MRHRVRLAIVLTLLAGTFCADRSPAVAAVKPRVEAGLAERFVARLSDSLGRTGACVRFVPQRRPGLAACRLIAARVLPAVPIRPAVSPCQFPQPPPATV